MGRFSVAFIAVSFLVFSSDADQILKLACEGDDLSERVKCKEENHGIQIQRAKFGRDNEFMCEPAPEEKNANNTRICGLKDVKEIIRPFCDGKQKCDSFVANTANLGEVEECRDVRKFLRMFIECVKITEPDEPEKPFVEKASKKKEMTIVDVHGDSPGTDFVQYEQVDDSSSSTKPVDLFMLLFLGAFCSLYY